VLEHFVARKLSFSGTSATMDLNSHAPKEAFHLDHNNAPREAGTAVLSIE
jgi:hypothetical protein